MIKVIPILFLLILLFLFIYCNYCGIENKEEDIQKEKVVIRILKDFDQRQKVRLFNDLVKTKKIVNIRKMLEQNNTDYYNIPVITDIFAYLGVNKTVVYAMFSVLNLPLNRNVKVEYADFVLVYRNKTYHNLFPPKQHVEAFRNLKFLIPFVIQERFFHATVIDNYRKNVYSNMYIEIL